MPAETPPQLILYNILPDTTEFMVVVGRYNAQVVRGFAQPVVGLPRGWFPEYKHPHPFSGMKLGEFVISRVAPTSSATTDADPAQTRAAQASADFDVNVFVVRSIARDPYARSKFKIANGGVFQVAQRRFRSIGYSARREYLKQFVEIPQAEHVRMIRELCQSPERPGQPPLCVPPRPTVGSPFEWDMSSEEAKAAALFVWSEFWSRPVPAAMPTTQGPGIPIPVILSDGETNAGWKQVPTPAERESMRDDWKKY